MRAYFVDRWPRAALMKSIAFFTFFSLYTGISTAQLCGNTVDACKGGTVYTTVSGDTCASISTKYSLGWDVLYALNPGLDCKGGQVALPAGNKLCVGTGSSSSFSTKARLSRAGPLDGHEYFFHNAKMTQPSARSQCKEIGADLASINSFTDNQMLYNQATTDFLPAITAAAHGEIWIGVEVKLATPSSNAEGRARGYDLSNVDGTAVNFTHWYSDGDPDNYQQNGTSCVYFGIGGTTVDRAAWTDAACSESYHFLCKRSFAECKLSPAPGGSRDSTTITTTTPITENKTDSGPNKAVIAGIAAGVIVLVLALAVGAFFIIRSRRAGSKADGDAASMLPGPAALYMPTRQQMPSDHSSMKPITPLAGWQANPVVNASAATYTTGPSDHSINIPSSYPSSVASDRPIRI